MNATQRTRHTRRIICASADVRDVQRRIRRAGGRVVLSSPVGLDSYAVDYVTGM